MFLEVGGTPCGQKPKLRIKQQHAPLSLFDFWFEICIDLKEKYEDVKIFVLPAYTENMHILCILEDINKDMTFSL